MPSAWFGFDRLRLADDQAAVDVAIGSPERWDKAHLRRLRQSADLPGLVPVIDADVASNGTPFAVTPAVDAPTLGEQIPADSGNWADVAGLVEGAARCLHDAHLRNLYHGALSPDQISVIGDDVAVSGTGVGLGGNPRPDYAHWVAPEVMQGADATERSDVYSLGKILEASLGDVLEDVPRSVRRLIMWSGSDTPEARPPSALEFASILAEALGDDRKVYGPAFIPTTDANQAAGLASEVVAGYTPSAEAGHGGPGAVAAAAGVAGAATAAAAVSSRDDVEDDIAAEAAEVEGTVTQQLPQEDLVQQPVADVRVDDEYEVPAAAQTIDIDNSYLPKKRNNRAGILLGAILAVGLIAAFWLSLGTGTSQPAVDEAADESTDAEEPSSPAVSAEDTGDQVTDAEDVEVALDASFVEGPVAAGEAAFQLVHGLPGVNVDLYVNGQALVPGFSPATIAGPVELEAGTYDVQVYAASDRPAAVAADRTDSPLLVDTITVGTDPTTFAAHYDADGKPVLTTFAEDLSLIDAGKGRVTVRHLAAAGPVTLSLDGETIANSEFASGESYSTAVAAGAHTLVVTTADGVVIEEASITVADGEAAVVSLIGVPGSVEAVFQNYTGLASAPVDVPTGTGGLLDVQDSMTGLYLLIAMSALMAASGGFVLTRRSRVL